MQRRAASSCKALTRDERVAIVSANRGEFLTFFLGIVVTRPGAVPSEAAIQQFALANAAPYLHPRRVWFVPEMPLAGINKIDGLALAKRAAELLATS